MAQKKNVEHHVVQAFKFVLDIHLWVFRYQCLKSTIQTEQSCVTYVSRISGPRKAMFAYMYLIYGTKEESRTSLNIIL